MKGLTTIQPRNEGAAANRRLALPSDGSDNLSATLAADRAFPAAVAELVWATSHSMPFTPFHFGPAAALKAVAPARFSFTLFCYSQVVTDLESGFYLFRGEYPVHRFFHTYLGATIVGFVCALTGRPICQLALRVCRAAFPASFARLFGRSATISWTVAFVSAFLGTYSHVFLDSIMHRDIMPLSPFANTNPMLHAISLPLLHLLCLALGVVGVLVFAFRAFSDDPPA